VTARRVRPRRLPAAGRTALVRQAELNRRLQDIIMPPPAPVAELNGVRIAVRYTSADPGVRIGGDWCVSVPLPAGELLLAVGDTVGLAAAATMSQLRHACAALAVAGFEPGDLLAALNTMLWQQGGDAMATAVVAKYRPAQGSLTCARAGHPPLLLAHGAHVRPWYEPPGVMLGAVPGERYRQVVTALLPGDLLLMYTDALVERPGRRVDEGVDALVDQVRASMAVGHGCAADVVDRIQPSNPDDDACVLVAEPLPAGHERAGHEWAGRQPAVRTAEPAAAAAVPAPRTAG
jgi:serine phosphatase RsbU (regulator of sigma subunit)